MKRVIVIPVGLLETMRAAGIGEFSLVTPVNNDGTLLVCDMAGNAEVSQAVIDWLDARPETTYVLTKDEWDSQKEGLGFGVL